MRISLNVFHGSLQFHRLITRNNAQPFYKSTNTAHDVSTLIGRNSNTSVLTTAALPRAWSIQKHTVESSHDFRKLFSIVAANNGSANAQSMQVSDSGLLPIWLQVIGDHGAGVAHQLCDIRGLATRS